MRIGGEIPRAQGDAGVVGASILQTPGGIQAELDRINSEFLIFGHEIGEVVTNLPGFPAAVDEKHRPLVDLFSGVWSPLVQEWEAFYASKHGWWTNLWWNHAPEAESYLRQLTEVRERAEKLGMRVASPAPWKPSRSLLFDPEHSVVDDAGDAARSAASDAWRFAKVAAYVGLGVVGVVVVTTAYERARGARA